MLSADQILIKSTRLMALWDRWVCLVPGSTGFLDTSAPFSHCEQPTIDKTRHTVTHAGREWVVDEFEDLRAGLVWPSASWRRWMNT